MEQVLGHYRILEKIGAGGMGEVYRASDDRLGRFVALKILKSSFAHDQDRLRRFEQEARSAAALSHPNIVAVYDTGIHNSAPFIVTEFLEGQTLRQLISQGPLSAKKTADYARQIAYGLVAAHEKRIVHRDLKPENIFITKDDRVKILDFGIAKLTVLPTANSEEETIALMTTQTKVGSVLGTVAYMSPEQLRGQPVDHRSDIFSTGSIIYEMLTGQRAFSGATEVDTMTSVLKDDPPEVSSLRQGVPAAFEQIVRHCLEKDPQQRFQSARDLAFSLESVSGTSSGSQIVALRKQNLFLRRWLAWVAVGVLVAGFGVALGFRLKPKKIPVYSRATFQRGTIFGARFSPDGNILYAAAWNGRPMELFSTINGSLMARSLGFTNTQLLAVSPSNELALDLNATQGGFGREFIGATLASAPLVGGSPREILHNVTWADWNAENQLAVVHRIIGGAAVEYPIGKVLYKTTGWITDLRFSPHGDRLAFLDHPAISDDRGSVCTVDLNGKETTLTKEWQSADGLAWSRDGQEVWFSAGTAGMQRDLWATDLNGGLRKLVSVPGGLTLRDISADGRALVSFDQERLAMEWSSRNGKETRDLSWFDWTIPRDISSDGKTVLFEESGEPGGEHYSVAIRKTDGSPPVLLGEGSSGGLSPDGKWAAAVFPGSPSEVTLYPVGVGQPVQIPLPQMEHVDNGSAIFLPDGKHLILTGNQPGHIRRTYEMDLTGHDFHAITAEGQVAQLPSPDGKFLASIWVGSKLVIYSIDGSAPPQNIPGLPPEYTPVQWAADGKSIYVESPLSVPMRIYKVEIKTGKMTEVQTIMPADRDGVVYISPILTDPNGSAYVYSYYQLLSNLYVISGLK
jgi:eukaryotic-like serine/threonine-protein kinase